MIDIHSHIGDPWYAYWKKNVGVEDRGRECGQNS